MRSHVSRACQALPWSPGSVPGTLPVWEGWKFAAPIPPALRTHPCDLGQGVDISEPPLPHLQTGVQALGDAIEGGQVNADLIFQISPVTQPRRPNQTAIHLAQTNFKAIHYLTSSEAQCFCRQRVN